MNVEKPNIREIFSQALDIESAAERATFLDRTCQENEELRQKVDNLLLAHEAAGQFMNGTDTAPASPDHQAVGEGPGSCIGPYKLREQIGEGGFGVVYVAQQEDPISRKVALKIIKPGMDTKDVIARFEAERQALALMDHPNVAKVLDAGATESGRPYFVMELVYGIPLTEFCDEQKLSNRERLRLLVNVCHAIQHAHQKGIIHRDLKPSNIMVTMHDDKPVPKVIDFGVAKALSQKLTDKTVYTSYNQMVGTPLYMSPEQAQMSGLDLDTRSDIYSLGVLLYELLTGTTPFDKETIKKVGYDELRRIIREDDPPRPSARVSTLQAETLSTAADRRKIDQRKLSQSLRGELDWIVMKAMEKDRSRRYETVGKLAEDVENYLHDEPVTACSPSIGYRFRKFARRNRLVLTSSALVALSLILGTIVSASQAVRASTAEGVANEQRNVAVVTAERAKESALAAREERDAAIAAREELRRVLYASELNLVQVAWNDGNYRRVSHLLEGTRPRQGETDLRGFEWHYWNRMLRGPLETRSVAIPGAETSRASVISPDGTKLALRHVDGDKISIAIWDIGAASELCRFQSEDPAEPRMYFSPDGALLAAVPFRTGHLQVWDARTGKKLAQIEEDETVYAVLFSGDANRLVYTYGTTKDQRSPSDYGYKVWDVAGERSLFSHRFGGELFPFFTHLSLDGRQIGVAERQQENSRLQIWDAMTAKVLKQRVFDGDFWFRAMSPDGSRLLVYDRSFEDRLQILDAQSLETIAVLHSDGAGTTGVFSQDGRWLAAPSDSSEILVWNLDLLEDGDASQPVEIASPTLTLPVERHHGPVRFSPDGRQLLSYSDNRLRIWEMPQHLHAPSSWSEGQIVGGNFNSDCTRAVLRANPNSFSQPSVLLNWDVVADREIWRFEDPRGDRAFGNPLFSPDGSTVVVPSRKVHTSRWNPPKAKHDELLLLDGENGKVLWTYKPEGASNINNMFFASEGKRVAVIVKRTPNGEEASFQAVVCDTATGHEALAVDLEDTNPSLVGFSRDGKELLVAQRTSGGVLVLDAATGESLRIIAPEGTILNNVGRWTLSPDGKTLAVLGLKDRYDEIAVEFYDAASGELTLQIPVHTEYPPISMSWSRDARRLALVSASAQWTSTDVSIWDTETGRLVLTLSRVGLTGGNHRALQFGPDDHRLLHIADNRVPGGTSGNPSTHPIHIWDGTPLAEE